MRARSSSNTRVVFVVAAAWLVVVGCVVAIVVVLRTRDGSGGGPGAPTAGAVRLEPVTYRSPSPFTPSVVATPLHDLPSLVARTRTDETAVPAGVSVSGDATRLYAVRSEVPVCDKEALATRLRSDARVRSAWAATAGVAATDVDSTLASLTPVVLRVDTAVTNHLYRGGEAVAYQSVLEAGTPVMVDPTGLPRLQCSCGNPLLAPAAQRPTRTDGKRWRSFDASRVVTVTPAASERHVFETVDVDSGAQRSTAGGTNVVLDGVLAAASDGLYVASPDAGEPVKVLDQQVDAVFDDGRGGVLYTLAPQGEDARYTYPGSVELASVWHLPAGATEAVPLIPPAQQGGWNDLLAVGRLGDHSYVAYTSLHTEDPDGSSFAAGPLLLRDLDSGAVTTLVAEAAGWEHRIGSVSFGGDHVGVLVEGSGGATWTILGPDLREIPTRCGEVADDPDQQVCPERGVLDDRGRMLSTSGPGQQTDAGQELTIYATEPSTGAREPVVRLKGVPADTWTDVRQVRNGRAVMQGGGVGDPPPWNLHDLSTGSMIRLPFADNRFLDLWVLSAPIVRPRADASQTTTTAPTTTVAPSTVAPSTTVP